MTHHSEPWSRNVARTYDGAGSWQMRLSVVRDRRSAPSPTRAARPELERFAITAARILLTAGVALAGVACGPDRPPNVLLISLDACRADHLGSYGYHRDTSPFLDELAAKGTRYRHAFANVLATLPSHTTILSSQYQETHRVDLSAGADGALLHDLPREMPFLPEILRRAGYVTVGATAGGFLDAKFGFDRGFDEYVARHESVERGTRRLVDLIRRHTDEGRPVFAFFHTYEIHSPYDAPAPFRGAYGEFQSDFEPTSKNLRRAFRPGFEKLSPQDCQKVVASYDEEIRFTDHALRRLFEDLGDVGFLPRALVVVTADHGEEFLEHGHYMHQGFVYEELLRVPLIVSGPVMPRGRVVDRLVNLIDVAPSILGYLGLPRPPAMQGGDIFGRGDARQAAHEGAVFSQFRHQRFAIRTPEWKLIDERRGGRVELYDIARDPREQRNVAAQHPRIVSQLLHQMARWRDASRPLDEQGRPVRLDEDELEGLKALGYLTEH